MIKRMAEMTTWVGTKMLYRLEPGLGQAVTQALQSWCKGLGARGARLVVYSPGESCCPCQPEAHPADNLCSTCMVKGPRPLQAAHQGYILGQCGEPSLGTSSCLACRLSTGDILALQVDVPEGSSTALVSPNKEHGLAALLLMLARETLERQAVEARLEETRERSRSELRAAIKAQEDEREWLALEVHDRLAQTLATVFQQLQSVESLARSFPEIRQTAVYGSMLCREVIRETRNIMNDLRPPVLDELGLAPLMEEELRRLEQEAGCQVQQSLSYPARPPRDVEVVLYRIFHEALINIQRHANATRLTVSLAGDAAAVRLEVEDNGVGFDVSESLAQKRVGGLMSMRRRAELAGGTCSIESKPGLGTRVTARIPVAGGQP